MSSNILNISKKKGFRQEIHRVKYGVFSLHLVLTFDEQDIADYIFPLSPTGLNNAHIRAYKWVTKGDVWH